MLAIRFLIGAAVVLLVVACSSGTQQPDADPSGDDVRILPEGLRVMALPGGNGVLELIALTLRKGPSSTELYAALKNKGDVPACDAALSVELFDTREESIAAGIGALFTQHFYRLTDGSETIAACAGPGDVTMAAVMDLPSDIEIDDVGTIVYRCPYFALDVVPVDGLSLDKMKSVTRSAGSAYTGTLVNELDVSVSNASVTVFPVNRVGRPLGVATGSGSDEIPPGGSWDFETESVDAPAIDFAAYPAGAFAN
jgi:hypothetical protein